jgi:hypothetical protein
VRWQLVAESGLTSEGVLQRLIRARPRPADVALIVVGVNDITKDVPLAFALRQRQHIADWLHVHAGVRHVVSCPARNGNVSCRSKPLAWYGAGGPQEQSRAGPLQRSSPRVACRDGWRRAAGSVLQDGFHPRRRWRAWRTGSPNTSSRSRSPPPRIHLETR